MVTTLVKSGSPLRCPTLVIHILNLLVKASYCSIVPAAAPAHAGRTQSPCREFSPTKSTSIAAIKTCLTPVGRGEIAPSEVDTVKVCLVYKRSIFIRAKVAHYITDVNKDWTHKDQSLLTSVI